MAPDTAAAADGGRDSPEAVDAAGAGTTDASRTAAQDGLAGADGSGGPPGGGVVSPATGPIDAVEGFLAAEQAGDLERSFRYLSASDREQVPTAGDWIAAHADVLPPVTGFEVNAVDASVDDGAVVDDAAAVDEAAVVDEETAVSDRATVAATVRFEPGLDEVVGLTPALADVRWAVVQDAPGRWSIDLAGSQLDARYPPDDHAPAAARSWAQARQRCEPDGEWSGTLVAYPRLADDLCEAAGGVEVGAATPLDAVDATPFVTAFGEEAVGWARVVDVRSPVALRVVLAPVGDEWTVVGVLPPRR